LRHAEQVLLPLLEQQLPGNVATDLDAIDAHSLAVISALATVIKVSSPLPALALHCPLQVVFGIRPSCNAWEKLLDKCPTFVTKDKSGVFKMKPIASKRSVQVNAASKNEKNNWDL
jgi:hypothetical protein